MPRKYSGPLRKGERSARVPKRKLVLSKTPLNNTEKAEVTKIVKKIVKDEKEIFHIQGNRFLCENPDVASGQPNYLHITPATVFKSGGKISMCGLNVGESLSYIAGQCNTNSTYNPNGGNAPRFQSTSGIRPVALNGVSGQNIEGEYGYQKAFNQKLKVFVLPLTSTDEDTIEDAGNILNFRCLVVRVRTGNKASKFTPTLDGLDTSQPSLFKNLMGQDVGFDNKEMLTYDYENLKFNSEAWEKVRDIKFQLQRPYMHKTGSSVVSSERPSLKPSYKNININLKCPKNKIRYDDLQRIPISGWNYTYYTMVFCSNANPTKNDVYDDYVGWGMEALHESKFQEC